MHRRGEADQSRPGRPAASPRPGPGRRPASRIASYVGPSSSISATTSSAPSSFRPSVRRATAGHVRAGQLSQLDREPADAAAAPVTSTRLPSTKPATSSARSAVSPATGSVAACSKETPSGSSASSRSQPRPAPPTPRRSSARPPARRWRAAPVGGRPDDARQIPSGHRARLDRLEPPRLAAVEADRPDLDQRLVGPRVGSGTSASSANGGDCLDTSARIGGQATSMLPR